MFNKFILATVLLASSFTASANITRTRVEDFTVEPSAQVRVRVNGGAINVRIGPPGQVHLELKEITNTNSEKEADDLIAEAKLVVEKTGNTVRVETKSGQNSFHWSWIGGSYGVRFDVDLVVPANVNLFLDTSGGSIKVDGEVQGTLNADTSGGAITVTGATGELRLDTSGGSISVDRVMNRLSADTSGGSIHVGYVSANAVDVNADTSGGTIQIGLDPSGNYDLYADTSGGNVNINDLAFNATKKSRTHAEGKINKGGIRVRADTSGGNVEIRSARP
jgi:hypothetical protein